MPHTNIFRFGYPIQIWKAHQYLGSNAQKLIVRILAAAKLVMIYMLYSVTVNS